MAHEIWDVFTALAQGGDADREDVEPIEEIGAETAGGDFMGEIAMGGGDEANVNGDRHVAADALNGFFLQHAQEHDLDLARQLRDLVEKEGALVGQFEAADAAARRAGEGAGFMAEQLAGDEIGGEGGAVDGDHEPIAARADLMDGAGDEFLAGAGFAVDQDGAVLSSDLRDGPAHRLHGRAFARQRAQAALGLDLPLQVDDFA